MAAVSGVDRVHATLSTTVADTVTLTARHRELTLTNHHATVPLYAVLTTGSSLAGTPTPATAVSGAAETFAVAPGQTRRLFRSARGAFAKLSVVGNANPYSVQGNNSGLWADNL